MHFHTFFSPTRISIFEKILLEIEKIVKTFSISNKFFPKLICYYVFLEYTLVKFLFFFKFNLDLLLLRALFY